MPISALKDLFSTPDATELARRELAHDRRQLLEAERYAEYYARLREFYRGRINTLERQLQNELSSPTSDPAYAPGRA